MHLPWLEERGACGEPGLRHGLPEFKMDLMTLDKPSASSKGAGTTLTFQRKAVAEGSLRFPAWL